MRHEELQERLLDLAYGELAPREAREVEEHARTCDACRVELARIQGTRRVMSALGDEPAPAGGDRILLAAAREAVAARPPRRGVPRWLWGGAVAAASLAAVVAVSLRLGDVAPKPSVRDEPDALLGTSSYAEPPPPAGPEGAEGAGGDSAAKAEAAPAREPPRAERPAREAGPASRAAGPRAPAPTAREREREAPPADAWAAAPEPPPGRAAAAPSAPAPEPTPAPQADVGGSARALADAERGRPAAERRAEAAPERRAAPAPPPAAAARAMSRAPEAAGAAEARDAPEPDDSRAAGIAWYERLRGSGKLTAEVREFPGCARESWRRIERDPAGRIVSYSWRSDEAGARFEVIYLPDGRAVKRGFDPQTGEPEPFAKFRAPRAEEVDLDAPTACERPTGRP